ncbi:MAG: PPC domain-containing DNA-binding protein [Anaerolineae bacterium]
MKYAQAQPGRVYILRLEHGDVLHEEIERFCETQSIRAAALLVVGGADRGSRLVVGPQRDDQAPIVPQIHALTGVHEVAGTGTVFWDQAAGRPTAHIHLACGRGSAAVAGCARQGVVAWQIMEIVLWELTGTSAARVLDPQLGFSFLQP